MAGGKIDLKTVKGIGNDQDIISINLSPHPSMKFLWRSGNRTATKRSKLIATMWKTELLHEIWDKMEYVRSNLFVHSWKNVLWIITSKSSGSHTKVTIRSAIAKLNKR